MFGLIGRVSVAAISVLALTGATIAAERCAVPRQEFMQPNAADAARIEDLSGARTLGLAQALASDSSEERNIVSGLMGGGFEPVRADKIPLGSYQCRTIKLGGLGPMVVYSWFACEIGMEEQTVTVRKVTGSQNFLGFMVQSGESMFYRGASSYGYEDFTRFYGDEEDHNQVGCFSAIDAVAGHFVLEFPYPKFESIHDLIEFRKN